MDRDRNPKRIKAGPAEGRKIACLRWALFLLAATVLIRPSLAASAGPNAREADSPEGGLKASVLLVPAEPSLSDTVSMTISVQGDRGWTAHFSPLGDRYGSFYVREVTESDPVIQGEQETRTWTARLVPAKAGEQTLPPITLSATSADRDTRWTIPPGKITVHSKYDREVVPSDLAGVVGKFRSFPWLTFALIVVLLAAAGVVWHLLTGRRREAVAPEVVLPPWQRALLRLEELMASKLYATDVKEFYLQLTGIVRWCIEETTGLRAPEQTTEEFLDSLEHGKNQILFTAEQRQGLRRFLEFSDLVKFARFRPTLDEIFDGAARARRVIEEQRDEEQRDEAKRGGDE